MAPDAAAGMRAPAPELSILIPTYNEEATLEEVVRRIVSIRWPVTYEVLVIDDSSADRTLAVAQRLGGRFAHTAISVLRNRVNKGKGACIRQGLKHARGRLVIVQDADVEYDPQDIPALLAPVLSGRADVAYGSRFLGRRWPIGMAAANWLANLALTGMFNRLYGGRLTDLMTCYKVMPAAWLRAARVRANRFEFDPEMSAKLARLGARVIERPIGYRGRTRGQGKKIRAKDFFLSAWALIRCRVTAPPGAAPGGRGTSARGLVLLGPLLIAAAVLAAYAGSLDGPWLFDDEKTVVANQTIRSLWPLPGPLAPPAETPVSGRPLSNLTFALNYALGGLDVRGYRAVNLGLHLACAWLLFGLIRRLSSAPPSRGGEAFALAVALLWAVHPLQTESVLYVTQRTELLTGCWMLMCVYSVVRAAASRHSARWHGAAILSCAAGMASKEVAVVTPLLVLLTDRVFLAGSVREALRRRRWLYAGLAACWGVTASLLASNPHGAAAGFGFEQVPPMAYILTQAEVLLWYLRLSVWPHPLALHYDWPLVSHAGQALVPVAVIAALLAATLAALRLRPRAGFAAAWAWLALAPTTLVPIATEIAAERRMYLALAGVLALAVWASARLLAIGNGSATPRPSGRARLLAIGDGPATPRPAGRARLLGSRRVLGGLLAALAVLGFGMGTARRVGIFGNEVEVWAHTVRAQPHDHLARNNIGVALTQAGRYEDAIVQHREALRLGTPPAEAHNNIGVALAYLGRMPEAAEEFRLAIGLEPDHVRARNNFGSALLAIGRVDDAIPQLEAALRLEPAYAMARINLARALNAAGRVEEAVRAAAEALGLPAEDPRVAAVLNARGW
ncbi:MAG TPA: glycosyltransferase [bacterium]